VLYRSARTRLISGDSSTGIRIGMHLHTRLPAVAVFIASWAALGCGSSDEKPPLSPAAQRGERVYRNVCIACHNANPSVDGSVGPAIAGATRELLEARVVHGTYPPGYTPKRDSAAMPKFAYLADHIDDLHAYLDEVSK
jgi:mono/diheme cytochrome c family protein